MADKEILSQMLEHLVNENQEKAEELFHDYVVARSREIYESLIEEEMEDEETNEATDEEVDESSDDEKVDEASDEEVDESTDDEEVKESSDDDDVDESFEDIAIEADDEMDADMGGDPTDDLAGEIGDEEGDEEGEKSEEELFQDLDSIVDELQAKFDELKGEEEGEMDDMEGDDEAEEESFMSAEDQAFEDELATVREYVEKVAGGHGAESKGSAESADNKKSVVDNMKNDMGGTTANIAKGGEDSGKNDGGLADINAKEDNAGNVNTPGSKNATKMSNEKGHGAEKKGSAESADNKQSLFRGRR
jgi:hypothetical protein